MCVCVGVEWVGERGEEKARGERERGTRETEKGARREGERYTETDRERERQTDRQTDSRERERERRKNGKWNYVNCLQRLRTPSQLSRAPTPETKLIIISKQILFCMTRPKNMRKSQLAKTIIKSEGEKRKKKKKREKKRRRRKKRKEDKVS